MTDVAVLADRYRLTALIGGQRVAYAIRTSNGWHVALAPSPRPGRRVRYLAVDTRRQAETELLRLLLGREAVDDMGEG